MAPLEWDATWGPEPGAPGLRPPTDRTVLAVPATILREASPCGQIRARHSRRLRKVWVMEAVIATGGKQYRVAPGQVISIEKLPGETGSSIEFRDRKSTRLNSSHANISYAVFCLKKKTNRQGRPRHENKSYR